MTQDLVVKKRENMYSSCSVHVIFTLLHLKGKILQKIGSIQESPCKESQFFPEHEDSVLIQ